MVKYEDIKKVLEGQAPAGRAFEESSNKNGKMLLLKDNAEVIFYFDKDDNLISVRAY
jgi:hypothetical protein